MLDSFETLGVLRNGHKTKFLSKVSDSTRSLSTAGRHQRSVGGGLRPAPRFCMSTIGKARWHFDGGFLLGMTRLELANQLIEGQPAFHFAFIPMNWYRWRDSNPHYLVSKTSASFQLGYTGRSLATEVGFEPT